MMQKKKGVKDQPKTIKELELLRKRFEKHQKNLKDPWRKCENKYKEWVQDIIDKLNNHICSARKGKLSGSSKLDLLQILQAERSIGINLMMQNLLKSSDREVTPFGEEHDLSEVYSK